MISRAVLALCLSAAALCSSAPSRAAEPAAAEPAAAEPALAPAPGAPALAPAEPDRTGPVAPPPATAPGPEPARSWLARGGGGPAPEQPSGSSSSTPLTVGAVLIVVSLAAAALVLRQRRQKLSPLGPTESRLTVLSSSRVGPKAYAVTAHINGRPLLLGVTDHNVTLLGWLDARDAGGVGEALGSDDDLPDDYPGSALRGAGRTAAPLASTRDLKRFQKVLLGVEQSRPGPPLRPSQASGGGSDAASLLAAQTVDVVGAPARGVAASEGSQTPVSVRRKRHAREAPPAPEPRAAGQPAAGQKGVEGQVAGLLRSLRNG